MMFHAFQWWQKQTKLSIKQESVRVKRFRGSTQFCRVQICLVWLPGSSIKLACVGRLDLVQHADRSRRWVLMNWLSSRFYFRCYLAQRESRSSKHPWLASQRRWINIQPTLAGKYHWSLLKFHCTHRGHGTQLTSPPVQFPLWGSRDQNLFPPLIQFNRAWQKAFISALGESLPVSERKNRLGERCMLINC